MKVLKSDNHLRTFMLLLLMAATMALRFWFASDSELSALSNFSPVGAMALFGGAYFSRYRALAFPLLTLLVSDLLLNRFVFYGEWQLFYEGAGWTYGAFALMALTGHWLLRRVTARRFLGAGLLIVFIHWIVTDLGVWLGSAIYPMTPGGYVACLIAAIPFELNFLAGTLFYGAVLFGGFEYLQQRNPVLAGPVKTGR